MADDGFGDAMTLLDRADIEAIVTGSKTTIVKAWLDATGDTPDMIEVSH